MNYTINNYMLMHTKNRKQTDIIIIIYHLL